MFKLIKATLQSQTVKHFIKKGYVFDGLLASGSGNSLLYRVIEVSSYKIWCAKVYPNDSVNDFENETSSSNLIHHDSIKPNIVMYQVINFGHISTGTKCLALLMPLYPISLSDIIEANCDTPVPFHHFKNFAKSLILAGSYFQSCGLAHCDIKPGNIMIDDGQLVLIDLGAVCKLGDAISESTRFYCLNSNQLEVDPTFDLNCVIVTLVQCFVHAFEVKNRTRDTLGSELKDIISKNPDLYSYGQLCLKLLTFQSCKEALDSFNSGGDLT